MYQIRALGILLFPLLSLLLSACDTSDSQKQAAASAPPPGVLVATARAEQVINSTEFIGRTVAVNDISLTAQVSGYLIERLFEEGAEVEADDLLFKIDPSIYEAEVAAAKGSVAKAAAALSRAEKDLKRYRELLKKQSVSQQQVDQAESDELQAKAELEAAQASLKKAETDLSFTEIRAPIKGRIGRALISVGNLVGPQSGVLARLVELDPIYVNFSISERDLLDVKQRQAESKRVGKEERQARVQVELRLANKRIYEHRGEIDFLDNTVDPKTGTVTLRARFDNPDGLLVPGLFVSTILSREQRTTELMIPQAAVQEDQTGRFVLVVAPDETIERRKITTGRQIGANLIVSTGLNPDERVVVEGIQKVRPGMKVEAKMAPRPEDDRDAVEKQQTQSESKEKETASAPATEQHPGADSTTAEKTVEAVRNATEIEGDPATDEKNPVAQTEPEAAQDVAETEAQKGE